MMRKCVAEYFEQFQDTLNFNGVSWWIIDFEHDPDYFYCNTTMQDTFSLDKNIEKHSVADRCPIAGDYNKNIDLATQSREKANIVFNEYSKLISQETDEYKNKFPYYNKELNKTFYFNSRAKVLKKNDKGDISILFGVIEDVTSYELQEIALTENLEIVDQYVMIVTVDLQGIITSTTTSFCNLSGYTKDELIGANHNIIRDLDTSLATYNDMLATIKNKQVWKGEFKNKKKTGEDFWIYCIVSPTFDHLQNIKGFTLLAYDITDKKTIEKLSKIDKLTNLYNRAKIDETLSKEIERAQRHNLELAIIMIDIDHFKSINDTYGHIVGDKILRKFSDLLKNNIRKIDTLGRWGGEEFIIISQNTNTKTAQILAEKLRLIIDNYDFETSTKNTASFGIAQYKKQDTPESLIIRADNALYRAKRNGRNRIELEVDK